MFIGQLRQTLSRGVGGSPSSAEITRTAILTQLPLTINEWSKLNGTFQDKSLRSASNFLFWQLKKYSGARSKKRNVFRLNRQYPHFMLKRERRVLPSQLHTRQQSDTVSKGARDRLTKQFSGFGTKLTWQADDQQSLVLI